MEPVHTRDLHAGDGHELDLAHRHGTFPLFHLSTFPSYEVRHFHPDVLKVPLRADDELEAFPLILRRIKMNGAVAFLETGRNAGRRRLGERGKPRK